MKVRFRKVYLRIILRPSGLPGFAVLWILCMLLLCGLRMSGSMKFMIDL